MPRLAHVKEPLGRPIAGRFFRDRKNRLFAPVAFRKAISESFVASAAVFVTHGLAC
jgi:hypothetical protein